MNNKEAAIACIQGKKVIRDGLIFELKPLTEGILYWANGRAEDGACSVIEPLYDTCWSGDGWEIYNEPLKPEVGAWYEVKFPLANHIMQFLVTKRNGDWVLEDDFGNLYYRPSTSILRKVDKK